MLYDTSVQTQSLYIHWPFCPYKCHFCPFVAIAGQDHFMASYHRALVREITNFAQKYDQPVSLETIYFGGGTPSTYPNELLLDMLGILKKIFSITSDKEITLEVNPGTVTIEKLHLWKEIGITRLSIGVQSLKDRVLVDLNRHQSHEDVIRLMSEVGEFFTNVSVDVILGLPGMTEQDWKELLATVVTWPIVHISLYMLEIHEGTALHFRLKRKEVELPHEESLANLYEWSVSFLQSHGFQQYEVSSFARPGYTSRHNTAYWDRKPYKGFGIGACSFDGTKRYQNVTDIRSYLAKIEDSENVEQSAEYLTNQHIINEKIMLGIRRAQGFCLDDIEQTMSSAERQKVRTTIEQLKAGGFIREDKGRIMVTPRGLLVENSIATQLAL